MCTSSFRCVYLVVCVTIIACVSSPTGASRYNLALFDVFAWSDTTGSVTFGRFDNKANATSQDAHGDRNKVRIEISEVREIDDDGEPIITNGHFYKLGTKNEFNFQMISGGYDSLPSVGVKFLSKMTGSMAGFSCTVHIMAKPGNITRGYKVLEGIQRGDVKLNFTFDGWDWCGPCEPARYGNGLELLLLLTSRERMHVGVSNNDHLETKLGGGATLRLPALVETDGRKTAMARGFPQIRNEGRKDKIIVRFPKFLRRASYDVTLRPGVRGYPPTTTTTTTLSTIAQQSTPKIRDKKLPTKDFANDRVRISSTLDRNGAAVFGASIFSIYAVTSAVFMMFPMNKCLTFC